ncbi:MAG: hypothetical protein JXR55_03425 [Candidatus Fermentibacteraceae bacterium]|nr:hypothetical protein [Candidatus Fermentibacteraceae bacterium]
MVVRMVFSSLVLVLLASMNGCGGSGDGDPSAEMDREESNAQGISEEGVTLEWELTGDEVKFSVSAPTTGWLAVGFGGESAMLEADIVIGYVEHGEVFISDQWGDGYTSHSSDVTLGGTSDAVALGGSEEDGRTSISFIRPISTGDALDRQLDTGDPHRVIIAYGQEGADDFAGRHRWVETYEIVLVPEN